MTSTDDRVATEDGLSDRVAHLQNAMHRLGADVIRLQTQLSDVASATPKEDDAPANEETPFIFNLSRETYKSELSSLVTWVNEFLVPVYVGEAPVWCPVWWEHHEAVGRLHALRLAYQELTDTAVSGPTGPALWHRDHLDPVLERLCSESGPFASCLSGTGHVERRRSQAAAHSA